MADNAWYVLACLECGEGEDLIPMPFQSPESRGKWAAAHTEATGHDRWFVDDEPIPALEDSATVAGFDTEAVIEVEEAMADLLADDSGSGYYRVENVPPGFYVSGANTADYRRYYPISRVEVDRERGCVTLYNRSNLAMRTYGIRDRVLAVCPGDIPDPVEDIDPREYL